MTDLNKSMEPCMLHLEHSENIRERNGLVGSVFLLSCWSFELCLRIYECFWTLVTQRQGFRRNREKEGWGLESLGRLDPLATHLWCSRDWPENDTDSQSVRESETKREAASGRRKPRGERSKGTKGEKRLKRDSERRREYMTSETESVSRWNMYQNTSHFLSQREIWYFLLPLSHEPPRRVDSQLANPIRNIFKNDSTLACVPT